jgi:hypothetical protein
MTKALGELGKKAGIAPKAVAEPAKPADTTPPAPAKASEAAETPKDAPPGDKTPPAAAGEPVKATPEASAKGGKESPWKLVESYKARNANLEREIAELRTRGDPVKADALVKRAEAAEARARELEEHIRFVDFSKSTEFADKYQKPYQEAWARAGKDLAELTIDDGGTTRAATVQDLVALANMPLGAARAKANEMFGDAADDVMAHRRHILDLSEAQQKALDDARKAAGDREKQTSEAGQQAQAQARQIWSEYNASREAKWSLMQPKEGDDEWNGRLEKAKDFVDRWWAVSAFDPKMSADDRRAAVQNHAEIRHRAIGFQMVRLENKRLKASVADLEAKLAQFKGSQPTNGGGRPASDTGTPGVYDPMARSKADLRSRAKAA